MAFAEELSKNRKRIGFTQETLAEKCDVSRQAVAKWEKGESLPDVYMIAKLANMFGITIEDLIWSKETAILENKLFYIQTLKESDKKEFLNLLREHKYLGCSLRLLEKSENSNTDKAMWEIFSQAEIYGIYSKELQKMIGYYQIENMESSGPTIGFQLSKELEYSSCMHEITKEFLNMLYSKYRMKAIRVVVNAELEQDVFGNLGYGKVKDEVIVILPM